MATPLCPGHSCSRTTRPRQGSKEPLTSTNTYTDPLQRVSPLLSLRCTPTTSALYSDLHFQLEVYPSPTTSSLRQPQAGKVVCLLFSSRSLRLQMKFQVCLTVLCLLLAVSSLASGGPLPQLPDFLEIGSRIPILSQILPSRPSGDGGGDQPSRPPLGQAIQVSHTFSQREIIMCPIFTNLYDLTSLE